MADHVIPAGTVFVVTHGAYSDFSLMAIARAKKDINVESALRQYAILYPPRDYRGMQGVEQRVDVDKVLAWLVGDSGLAEELPFSELYMGGGDIRGFFVSVPGDNNERLVTP